MTPASESDLPARRPEEEACILGKLILAKASATSPTASATSPTASATSPRSRDDLAEFIVFRFANPLKEASGRAPWYAYAFSALSIATIAGGLATSALAAFEKLDWLVVLLGIAVGVFAAVNQIWRPALRSVGRYQARNALRREGWDYLNQRGRYSRSDLGPENELDLFIDEIGRIYRALEAIDEDAADPSKPGP